MNIWSSSYLLLSAVVCKQCKYETCTACVCESCERTFSDEVNPVSEQHKDRVKASDGAVRRPGSHLLVRTNGKHF